MNTPVTPSFLLCKGSSVLTAERYEEAVEFATQACEANAEFPDIYAVLAAASGQLNKAAAAGAALEELLRRMPGLTASEERLNRPFAREIRQKQFLDGLRKAGMPA